MDTIGADGTAVSISGSIRTVWILILIVPPGVVCHCAISFAHGTDENTISLLAQSGAHDKTQSNAGIRIVPHFLQAASSTAAAANGLFQSSCRQQAVVRVSWCGYPCYPCSTLFYLSVTSCFTEGSPGHGARQDAGGRRLPGTSSFSARSLPSLPRPSKPATQREACDNDIV